MAALPQEKLDEFSPVIRKFQSLGIQLVPVKGKIPACGDGWQNSRLSESELIRHLMNGSSGLGVICGEISRGLVVVDYDCTDAFREADLRKRETGEVEDLPTPRCVSGIADRVKVLYWIPEEFWTQIQTSKIKVSFDGDGQLEILWRGCQAVMPPSSHPTTNKNYCWVNGWTLDIQIAEAPLWVVKALVRGDAKPWLFPLSQMTSHENQKRLKDGSPKGSRNNSGTALIRDLIGCQRWLDDNGIPYSGDPLSLLNTYGENCKPPIDGRELDQIYNSAIKGNCEPARSKHLSDRSEYSPSSVRNYYQRHHGSKFIGTLPEASDSDFDLYRSTLERISNIRNPLRRSFEIDKAAGEFKCNPTRIEKSIPLLNLEVDEEIKEGPEGLGNFGCVGFDELLDTKQGDRPWLFPNVVYSGASLLITGLSGTGKTQLAVDLAHAVLTGESAFLGSFSTVTGKVLILGTDRSRAHYVDKLKARGFPKTPDIMLNDALTSKHLQAYRQLLKAMPDIKVVIVDCLRSFCQDSDLDENSPMFANVIRGFIKVSDSAGVTLIGLHHTNKDPHSRGLNKISGSTNIPAVFQVKWVVENTPTPDELRIHSVNNDGAPADFFVKREPNNHYNRIGGPATEDKYTVDVDAQTVPDEPKPAKDQIWDFLKLNHNSEATAIEAEGIANELGLRLAVVKARITDLVNLGMVSKTKSKINAKMSAYFVLLSGSSNTRNEGSIVTAYRNNPPESDSACYAENIDTVRDTSIVTAIVTGLGPTPHFACYDGQFDNNPQNVEPKTPDLETINVEVVVSENGSKVTDLWRTPNTTEQPILNLVTQTLGSIGLDPTADNDKTIAASTHFTKADDCLTRSWKELGPVYMNPPFSAPLPFVQKLVQSYHSGDTPSAIALLKAGTLNNKGTGSLIWGSASAICHWGGGKARRIAFLNEHGVPNHGADFDCVVVYWGRDREKFRTQFNAYGYVSFIDPDSDPDGGNPPTPTEPETNGHHLVIDPRQACSVTNGRLEVDLESLDLDYQPTTPIPPWEPTKQLKPYERISKLYLDIETSGLDPECSRVLMVGFMDQNGHSTILTNPDEKLLLQQTLAFLKGHKPELLITHNGFAFDLPFLIRRWEKYRLSHPFKVGNKPKRITASSFNGKPIEFTPIQWGGIDILDSLQEICIWDKSAAKLPSYGLKSSVLTLGLRDEQRLELTHQQIQRCWAEGDTATLEQYLRFDLEDTQLLADFLVPVVYYQLKIVPKLSLQDLAVASPALKAQKIHQFLLPHTNCEADEKLEFTGGLIECLTPGLHHQAAKIDISSLYPSIMLRYGLCSRKDPSNKFLGVLQYMRQERLRLKVLAKAGDSRAEHEQSALKVLINGSYGYFGTQRYAFNDYQAAALVTGYGRKILNLMVDVVTQCEAAVIETDTDGIIFSHANPQAVMEQVQSKLPTGIKAELEFFNCGVYVPKAKNYVIVPPDGKLTIKGQFRKRNAYPLENQFPVEFLKRYFLDSPEVAHAYYQQVRGDIELRQIPIEQLRVTRKIGAAEKKLIELGLGQPGSSVSYYYIEQKRNHAKSGKPLTSQAVPSTSGEFWSAYYLNKLDKQYQEITKGATS